MDAPSFLFRVHFSRTSMEGVTHEHKDVQAPTPKAATDLVVASFRPRPIVVHKTKRVKGAA